MTDAYNQHERDAIKLGIQNQYFNANTNQFHPPYENSVAPYNDSVLDLNQYLTKYHTRFGKFLRFVIIWEALSGVASFYLTIKEDPFKAGGVFEILWAFEAIFGFLVIISAARLLSTMKDDTPMPFVWAGGICLVDTIFRCISLIIWITQAARKDIEGPPPVFLVKVLFSVIFCSLIVRHCIRLVILLKQKNERIY